MAAITETDPTSVTQFAKNHSSYYEVPLSVKYTTGNGRDSADELMDLETYHHILDLYLWLSYAPAPLSAHNNNVLMT